VITDKNIASPVLNTASPVLHGMERKH